MNRKIYGENADHYPISCTLHQIGKVAKEQRDYEDALKWCHGSLSMNRRIHGDDADHANILSTFFNSHWI